MATKANPWYKDGKTFDDPVAGLNGGSVKEQLRTSLASLRYGRAHRSAACTSVSRVLVVARFAGSPLCCMYVSYQPRQWEMCIVQPGRRVPLALRRTALVRVSYLKYVKRFVCGFAALFGFTVFDVYFTRACPPGANTIFSIFSSRCARFESHFFPSVALQEYEPGPTINASVFLPATWKLYTNYTHKPSCPAMRCRHAFCSWPLVT